MSESVAGVVQSGKQIKVHFHGADGDEVLEGTFVGVGADLDAASGEEYGEPIILVDEGKDTDQSVALSSVFRIQGGA